VTLKGLHRAITEDVAGALGLTVCGARDMNQMCQPLGKQAACVICRLFGSPWVEGMMRYRDLLTTASPYTATLTHAPLSRQRRVQIGRSIASREVLPAGTTFTGQIDLVLENHALLALAILGLRSITVLGADKAAGHGQCTVEAKATDATKRSISDADLAGALQQLIRGKP
jgi:CRISPR/Cas system CSM-associated protein Csm3 (group 7 of RAMP superfamily)